MTQTCDYSFLPTCLDFMAFQLFVQSDHVGILWGGYVIQEFWVETENPFPAYLDNAGAKSEPSIPFWWGLSGF